MIYNNALFRKGVAIGSICALFCSVHPVAAQQAPTKTQSSTEKKPETAPWEWFGITGQVTATLQSLFPFHSPYEGANSLPSRAETEISHTYTLYLGARLSQNLEAYLDPEMARGKGIGEALGLAGFTNGDVIRNPTLGEAPYLGRYFGRWTISTQPGREKVEKGDNVLAGMRPTHRIVITGGKFGSNDIFDTNSYANSTRTQFMNWSLLNAAAYDYAADTRGYTQGVSVEWVHPDWALRLGSFQMPTVSNGTDLAGDLVHSRGDQIEIELHPLLLKTSGSTIVRLLAYRNLAAMGNYRAALQQGLSAGTIPDITAVRRKGAVKYGFEINFEQPLCDNGDTGVFGRYAFNEGRTETFAYTEADRSLSLGVQVSGKRWRCSRDHVGIAYAQNDLSSPHKEYLEAGGQGFILGDGRLNYAPEQILEAYYTFGVSRLVGLSLDYQFIAHPGYNQDRGPVSVVSLRLHLAF